MIFFFLQIYMSNGDNFEIWKRKRLSAVGSSKGWILWCSWAEGDKS